MNTRWNTLSRPLILASNSPRRRELLGAMGFSFTVQPPSIDNEEEFFRQGAIDTAVTALARAKAASVAVHNRASLVMGCDTIVVIGTRVIGKPADEDDARDMLSLLSGRKHTVYTGVALLCGELAFEKTAIASSEVCFRGLEPWEIDEYLRHGEYADKAGAYSIQGKAMTFVDKIHGCFYNVMGLPITETIALFQAFIAQTKGTQA